MIKLLKLLNEDTFQSEEPSSFEGENEAIQEYVEAVKLSEPNGTTIASVMDDLKDAAHTTQLRALIELAKKKLLRMSYSNIYIRPGEIEKIFDARKDIAANAIANPNLNENNPCWDGYKVGNPKTKISSKTGERVNNCIPINELTDESSDVPEFLAYAKKQKYPGFLKFPSYKALHDYIAADKGPDFDELKQELTAIDPSWNKKSMNEAFFIGEDEIEKNNKQEEADVDVECEKCGWAWNTINSDESDKYICHKCGFDNSYRYANKANNETIDEYDVDETNLYEVKDFVKFMKEYTSFLNEAQCDCVMEAEYHGRKVTLGKPMQGDIKKFKVYVKNNKGKVVKVNFGFGGKSAKGKRMVIKAKNPKRRSAYRKRHHCDNPGPRWKANYWSCRKW
jgi:predicted RNA-binding Zn-ribbon protein involved in translation (DUF1610 family)